jgi:hypothetical protein
MTPDPTIDILHLQQQWGGTVRRAATAADVAIATAAVTLMTYIDDRMDWMSDDALMT